MGETNVSQMAHICHSSWGSLFFIICLEKGETKQTKKKKEKKLISCPLMKFISLRDKLASAVSYLSLLLISCYPFVLLWPCSNYYQHDRGKDQLWAWLSTTMKARLQLLQDIQQFLSKWWKIQSQIIFHHVILPNKWRKISKETHAYK